MKNNTNNQGNKDKTQNKQVELTRKQVVMTNERTYNSWVRTGLTAVVGAYKSSICCIKNHDF